MTGFLSRIGTVEARAFANSCPLGTSGRIHALRLRRRFQHSARNNSTATASAILDSELSQASFDKAKRHAHETFIGDLPPATGASNATFTIDNDPFDLGAFAPKSNSQSKLPPLFTPKKSASGKSYDQLFFDYAALRKKHDKNRIVQDPEHDIGPDPLWVRQEVARVLESNDPHVALYAIVRLSEMPAESLHEISYERFSQLLKMADLEYFFGGHSKFDKYVAKRSPFYSSFYETSLDTASSLYFLSKKVLSLFYKRKVANKPARLEDYQYLFKLWETFGYTPMSERILRLMKISGVGQDVECFNSRFTGLVEGGVWARDRKYDKMITSRYWPKTDAEKRGEQVNKSKISALFQEMMSADVTPTEETMCLMMTVFAREADMDSIKHLLDSVWGINLHKFLALGEEGVGKDFPDDSPVRPTGRLIETVAHVFGTNQDIALALRMMDFISRRYDIEIPLRAWEEVLERTFMLSKPKKKGPPHSTSEDYPRKPLPQDAVENLWNTMTGPPYNIQPNITMYNMAIKSMMWRQRFGRAEELMEEARVLHKQNVQEFQSLLRRWRGMRKPNSGASQTELVKLEHEIWLTTMMNHRTRQYIREWVRNLISKRSRSRYNLNSGDNMTGVVARWQLFLPKEVEYEVATGYIELKSDSKLANDFRVKSFKREFSLGIKTADDKNSKTVP